MSQKAKRLVFLVLVLVTVPLSSLACGGTPGDGSVNDAVTSGLEEVNKAVGGAMEIVGDQPGSLIIAGD